MKWLAVSASLAAIAFGSFVGLGLWGAHQQEQQKLVLQQQLLYNKLSNLQDQITDSRTKAKTKAAYYFELQRDAQRGGGGVAPNQAKTALPSDETVDPAIKEANSRKQKLFRRGTNCKARCAAWQLIEAKRLQRSKKRTQGSGIRLAAEQKRIIERVRSAVSGIGDHNQQRKLRVALYATAAIPKT